MPTPELPSTPRLGRALCADFHQAERHEWWLADGRGAYAAGTVAGSLSRRYHGLLIAPTVAPLGRHLLVTKADATAVVDGRRWPLFANRWMDGSVAPAAQGHLESFHLHGQVAVWIWRLGRYRVETRTWMPRGKATTYVAWRWLPDGGELPEGAHIEIIVLGNGRDHHGETDLGFRPQIAIDGDSLVIMDKEHVTLHGRAFGGQFAPAGDWYRNFLLPMEGERGLNDVDHHLALTRVTLRAKGNEWMGLAFGLKPVSRPPASSLKKHLRRDQKLLRVAESCWPNPATSPGYVARLLLSADAFLIKRPLDGSRRGDSVIAGYPWFGDWGRDTMIALPGLTLATGRYKTARSILETFAGFVDQGMLPNRFPGNGETPEYNTVDAALWYVEAWRAYVQASGDHASLAEFWPTLVDIIRWHAQGTRHGIGMDQADGLLRAGEPGVQLTWMDAKLGDWVVTPRIGKPVEINALWYNALRVMEQFADLLGEDPQQYASMAERAGTGMQGFLRAQGGLFDVIDGPEGNDPSIRPNQIFAVSLPHSALDADTQARVVRECADELLTSFGLRSLAAGHRDYRGHYRGGVQERDSAYHQGPVWGWLLGHYCLAEYRVHGDAERALSLLEAMGDHLADAGLGTLSEIFDGDPPHEPRGAPSQAWSVACTLEAAWKLLNRF
ncbi:MAG: glycogen debranching enzyme family protein [Chromatiales bacterium]|nr:glycogen debranching enzyme family protein [Chromatiales bacterium]